MNLLGDGYTHLRGTIKTACGKDMWTTNSHGERVTAYDSVGWPGLPDYPITCPGCIERISRDG